MNIDVLSFQAAVNLSKKVVIKRLQRRGYLAIATNLQQGA